MLQVAGEAGVGQQRHPQPRAQLLRRVLVQHQAQLRMRQTPPSGPFPVFITSKPAPDDPFHLSRLSPTLVRHRVPERSLKLFQPNMKMQHADGGGSVQVSRLGSPGWYK